MTSQTIGRDDLIELERKFWHGDAAFYRQNLDDTCLIAFTQMSGTFGKDEIAGTIKDGTRWQDLAITLKGMVEPAPGVVLLTYQASAKRPDGAPYRVLVSSGYVKRGNDWKMAFHQHTPLPDGGETKA